MSTLIRIRIEYMLELILSDGKTRSVGQLLGIILNDCPATSHDVETVLGTLAAAGKVQNCYGNCWRQI